MYIEQSIYLVEKWNAGGGFYTNFSLGTPPQDIIALLDTTASGTYVQSSNYTGCFAASRNDARCSDGAFSTKASSSVVLNELNEFNWTFAAGDLFTDTFQIGSTAITNIELGLATSGDNTTHAQGALGLGYPVSIEDPLDAPGLNIFNQLKESGAINSNLFSMHMGKTNNDTGTIIFGGVDVSKYTGELVTLDVLPTPWEVSDNEYINAVGGHVLAITDISVISEDQEVHPVFSNGDVTGRANGSLAMMPNTASAWWEVTQDIYDSFVPLLPGFNTSSGTIGCDDGSQNISTVIRFNDAVNITVPLSDLIIPNYDLETGKQNITSDGLPSCSLALRPYNGSIEIPFYLGFSVLRSMYMVYDIDNGQISIAQAEFASSDRSNIYAVPSGTAGLRKALSSAGKSIATASVNDRIVTTMISAAVTSDQSFSVYLTSPAVAQATGTDALPTGGVVYPTSVVSSSTTSSGVVSSPVFTGVSASASSKTTASKGGAELLRKEQGLLSSTIVPAFLSLVMGFAALL